MLKLCVLVSLSIALFSTKVSFSQESYSSLKVTCVNQSKEPISGERFTLIIGSDSVVEVITGTNGELHIDSLLLNTDYKLVHSPPSDYYYHSGLELKTDSFQQEYVKVLTPVKYSVRRGPPILFYNYGETEVPENSDLYIIADLLAETPEMCLEYFHVIGKDESEKVLKKRKKKFLKELKKIGVNLSNIRFSDELSTLDPQITDRRSRINGAVYAVDGNCGE